MALKRKKAAALTGRRVRLFKNGRSQAVRIPREWALPGNEAVIRKDGDRLIVTKALGTGTVFAADMRQRAKGRWITAAITAMLQSNRLGAQCLRAYQATACTDVTGFGLLGHLVEMTRASEVDVTLDLRQILRQGLL